MSRGRDLGFTPTELATSKTAPPTPQPVESTGVEEISADTQQVIESARSSLDFLAALCMPLIFRYCFPPVFITVWEWLLSYVNRTRDFSQLVLGLPRGFGKSTVVKLFITYCILFTKKKFILVVAANAKLAENIIADVIDMLEEPNVRTVFGDWNIGIETNTQSLKKFGFRGRNITLAAVGSETSVRGLNLKNDRPDVMVMDDVQTRENADSAVQADSLERWIIGTLMKAKSPFGCMFLFIGNMYPTKHSILRKLKTNAKWTKFIAGGILSDGTSLWEELQPIDQLMNEFETDLAMGHPEIFYSEVLNDENASSNNLIELSKIPTYPVVEGDLSGGNFIIIDPANDKVNSDAVSIGYIEIYDARPILMEVEEGRFSPGDTIKKAFTLALKHNCRLIVIEANAYQYSLLYWFTFISEQLGISGIHCEPIYSGALSKNSRILTMFKELLAGEIYIAPNARTASHLQIMQFNPLRRDNTDGILDLLTYMQRCVEMFGEWIMSLDVIQSQEFAAIEVDEFNSCF